MAIKKKFIDFILKLMAPAKLVFLILSIVNVAGYWYYSYEQNIWLKIILIIITIVAYFDLIFRDEYNLISLLNVFLTIRNLYFAFVDSYLDFKPLMFICFLTIALIIYFSLSFAFVKQNIQIDSRIKVYTLFGSLAVTELFLLLSYWNEVPRPTKAILITITYYFLIRTIDVENEGEFNLKKLAYLSILTAILLIAVIYSVSWKEI